MSEDWFEQRARDLDIIAEHEGRSSPGTLAIGGLWRHVKTGHDYVILGQCRLEATNRPGILYRRVNGEDVMTWARDEEEFCDGRFIPVSTQR
jgi:hypothetical protein